MRFRGRKGGCSKSPIKVAFLKLAAGSASKENRVVDSSELTYARKAVMRSELAQLSPELQA